MSKVNPDSIKARLKNYSDSKGRSFQETLTYFAIERFLFRLGESQYHDRFILKGGLLLKVWMPDRYRMTKDIDLLGKGSNEVNDIVKIVKEVCSIRFEEDAISFDLETIRGERIKNDDEYMGVRVKFFARLGTAKIGLQLDIGFGDRTFPQPIEAVYLSILGFPASKLKMY